MPVAARSKASVCGRWLAGIAGLNPAGVYGCLPHVSVVCCQVEVCATGRSLVQRSPAECVCVCASQISWSLENEEALPHWGLLRIGGGRCRVRLVTCSVSTVCAVFMSQGCKVKKLHPSFREHPQPPLSRVQLITKTTNIPSLCSCRSCADWRLL